MYVGVSLLWGCFLYDLGEDLVYATDLEFFSLIMPIIRDFDIFMVFYVSFPVSIFLILHIYFLFCLILYFMLEFCCSVFCLIHYTC